MTKPKCAEVCDKMEKAAEGYDDNLVIDGCLNIVADRLVRLYADHTPERFHRALEGTCEDLRMMVAWQQAPETGQH